MSSLQKNTNKKGESQKPKPTLKYDINYNKYAIILE